MHRVVVTGVGVVSPVGIGKEQFWRNLLAGTSGAKTLDEVTCCALFGHHTFGSQVVCEVAGFDPEQNGVPAMYCAEDRYIQFAIAGARQAIRDARLGQADLFEAGCALATAICGTQTLDREFVNVTGMGRGPVRAEGVSPHLYAAACSNSAVTAIASLYGIGGECLTLSTGCIGGLDAIGYAAESIAWGEHRLMLAGAAEAPITPITVAAFDIINCLSRRNAAPATASRPFCRTRDGFVLSEGCGVVILEELEHALARGIPVYAEVTGWDVTEHATHMTDMSPEGHDLTRAMVGALSCGQLVAGQVDFVNAHGTSTPQNDARETQAIKDTLGEHAYAVPVNSTKSMLGHALAAASAMEVVACALALRDQRLHPTINLVEPDPDCDLDYVSNGAREHAMQRLLTTASGFSGLHGALSMEHYSGRRP